MSELPKGWTNTTLGEICSKPQYGWTSKASRQGRLKYVRTTDISSGQLNWDDVPFCELEPDDVDRFLVREDDILVSRAGSVGVSFRISDVPSDAVFASYLIRFNPLESVLPRYVEYFLRSSDYWRSISEFSAGIALPNVNASKLAELEIPLPPLNEQRRIVAKLEKLLSRVDTAQARLATIPRILKRFRQSILAAACSGRLTADWRKENSNIDAASLLVEHINQRRRSSVLVEILELDESPEDLPSTWMWARFGSVIGELRNGVSIRPSIEPPGTPILRISATRPGRVDLNEVRYLGNGHDFLPSYSLRDGDLLFTRYNGSLELLGVCGMVRGLGEKVLLYPDKLMRVRFDHDFVLPQYAELFFQAPDVHDRVIAKSKSSAGQNGVSGSDIKAQPFAVPPLAEQEEIVRRVEALFQTADALEARYRTAKAHVDKLTQSILARAFRGELVPQDPTDEPASVLLARVSQAGAQSERKPKRPRNQAAPAASLK